MPQVPGGESMVPEISQRRRSQQKMRCIGNRLDPTPPIELRTNQPDSDYIVWSAGVSAQFINGMSGFVNYQGTSAYSGLSLGELTFGLRWERTF